MENDKIIKKDKFMECPNPDCKRLHEIGYGDINYTCCICRTEFCSRCK